jgi:hypothetical protein
MHRARWAIQNGLISERALAICAGVSQTHTHHLLCGKRSCSIATGDALYHALNRCGVTHHPPPEGPIALPLAA